MKSVLISIQPKWCELIASGKKTVEVRKTRPRIDVPFKCYIYCTRNKERLIEVIHDGDDMGDFVHKGKPNFIKTFTDDWSLFGVFKGGQVIGEFVCNCMTGLKADNMIQAYYNNSKETCLTDEEIKRYANGEKLYYWHISDLVIYDKPKELSDFYLAAYRQGNRVRPPKPLTRAPQSWCYVEEVTP